MRELAEVVVQKDRLYSEDNFVCLSKEEWQNFKALVMGTTPNKPIMPCQKHGSVGIRLVTKVVCAECGEPVDRFFVTE